MPSGVGESRKLTTKDSEEEIWKTRASRVARLQRDAGIGRKEKTQCRLRPEASHFALQASPLRQSYWGQDEGQVAMASEDACATVNRTASILLAFIPMWYRRLA
ncbi:MAG: hypothetical protein WC637_05855 [Victivallales bacterium]